MADSKAGELNGALQANAVALGTWRAVLKNYYYLCKPGIVYSNVMTAAAGYLFASRWLVNFSVLLCTIMGTGFIIASACIFNNYIDRGIDSKMTRTKKRALVTGSISPQNAIGLGVVLSLLGILLLTRTNILTLGLGVLAMFLYVVVYGYFKRNSIHGTLVGTLPGAAALVAGYVAFRGRLDLTAMLLLLVMVTWQMAHFYCIAIYRLEDYKEAGIPVWPAVKGIESTRRFIVIYIAGFFLSVIALGIFGKTGYLFPFVMGGVSLYWLVQSLKDYSTADSVLWAKRLFFYSLAVLTAMAALLPLSTLFS